MRVSASVRRSIELARDKAYRDVANASPQQMARLEELAGEQSLRQWRVLDVGCGYHAPTVRLLSGRVQSVSGVDVEDVFLRDGWLATMRQAAARQGCIRGAKAGTWKYLFFSEYHRHVSRLTHQAVQLSALDVSRYDGVRMPYPDASFDVIVSTAVLEHVANVPGFAAECRRVLVPGGFIDMWMHNFYCPSGSHLPRERWAKRPWGHVVGELVTTNLNRLRPEEMEQHLARYFEDVRMVPADANHRLTGDKDYQRECEELLTREWRLMLSHLPEELLTTTGFVVQARKPAGSVSESKD